MFHARSRLAGFKQIGGRQLTLDVYADLFDSDFTAVADRLSETVGNLWARGAGAGHLTDTETPSACANASTVSVSSVDLVFTGIS